MMYQNETEDLVITGSDIGEDMPNLGYSVCFRSWEYETNIMCCSHCWYGEQEYDWWQADSKNV